MRIVERHRKGLLAFLIAIVATSAHALNFTQESVKGLAQAYGFVHAQSLSLTRIATEYPAMSGRAHHASARFDSTFPGIQGLLEAQLKAALPGQAYSQFAEKLTNDIRQNIGSQTVSEPLAQQFLDLVERRARGEIETPILEHLLSVQYAGQPAAEFSAGFKQRHEIDGSGKAKGVKLNIQVPRSWLGKDGERPNIVKKWTSQYGAGGEMIHVDIRDAEGYDPSAKEVDAFIRSGEVRTVIPDGARFIAADKITLERRPGYWIEFSTEMERMGMTFYEAALMYQVFFHGKAVGVVCQAMRPASEKAAADAAFKSLKPACQMVVNSVVLPQAY